MTQILSHMGALAIAASQRARVTQVGLGSRADEIELHRALTLSPQQRTECCAACETSVSASKSDHQACVGLWSGRSWQRHRVGQFALRCQPVDD